MKKGNYNIGYTFGKSIQKLLLIAPTEKQKYSNKDVLLSNIIIIW